MLTIRGDVMTNCVARKSARSFHPERERATGLVSMQTAKLFGGSLTLRDYDGHVAEALAMVRALNKMTKAGMPESVRII